jgi:indole-3-acetate monooxygenase
VRQACVHANREAADIGREAYLLAGTTALRDGPVQRCFRDLHAGAQHFFASNAASIDFARGLLAQP